jgi:hypothetical protein
LNINFCPKRVCLLDNLLYENEIYQGMSEEAYDFFDAIVKKSFIDLLD